MTFGGAPGGGCQRCAPGSISVTAGSTACLSTGAMCNSGFMPQAPLLSSILTQANCVPLQCPPFMAVVGGEGGIGCRGCGHGAYGTADSCRNCSPGALCPGYLPVPLAPDPASLALGRPACAALRQEPTSFAALGEMSAANFSFLIYAWLTSCAAVLGAFVSRRCPCCPAYKRGASLACFRRVDVAYAVLSLAANFASASLGRKLENKKTPLGGLCFLLFLFTLLALWCYLWMVFSHNVAVLVTTEQLEAYASRLQATAWAPSLVVQPTLPLPRNVNLQLRVFAQSELGCKAPLELNYAGVGTFENVTWSGDEPWLLQSPVHPTTWAVDGADCGGAPPVSLLTLSCVECALQPDSAITFALPFTCQSFALQAVFVDGMGTVGSVALDKFYTTALGNGGLLASVTWTLAPTISFLDDSSGIGGIPSARGFSVAASSASVTRVNPAVDLVGGGLMPLANAVLITVNLPLQPTVSHATMTPKQTWSLLLSNMFSFLGIISLFHILFMGVRVCSAQRKKVSRPLSSSGGREAQLGDGDPRGALESSTAPESTIFTENPLLHLEPVPLAPPQVWRRVGEGEEVWYVSPFGDTAWELPHGAVLAEGSEPSGARRNRSRRRSHRSRREEAEAAVPAAGDVVAPAAGDAVEATVVTRWEDGEDVWFVGINGETPWELPKGAKVGFHARF